MMAFQSFAQPRFGTEDVMETGEFDREFDQEENIDIDLELANDTLQPQPEPDEEMQEDSERPAEQRNLVAFGLGGSDTLMEDDAPPDQVYDAESVHDEIIQDAETESVAPDEDVIVDDLVEDVNTYQDQDLALQIEGDLGEQDERNSTDDVLGHVDEVIPPAHVDIHIDPEKLSNSQHESPLHDLEKLPEITALNPYSEVDSSAAPNASKSDVPTNTQEDVVEASYDDRADQENLEVDGEDETQEATTQDSTGKLAEEFTEIEPLHPIYVYYQDEEDEIYLFEPMNQDPENTRTFLLSGQALLHETVETVLSACRNVLKDNIGAADELEMSVDGLDLRFSESTVISPNLTFASLLATFTQLHRNEGVEPPPLCVHLYTRTNPSHRWQRLCNEANEGKGYSAVEVLDESTGVETEDYSQNDDEITLENVKNAIGDEASNGRSTCSQNTQAPADQLDILEKEHLSTDKDVEDIAKSTIDRRSNRDVFSGPKERQSEVSEEASVQQSQLEEGDVQESELFEHDDLHEQDNYKPANEAVDHAENNEYRRPGSSADSSTLKGGDSISANEYLAGGASSEPSTKSNALHPIGAESVPDDLDEPFADDDRSTGSAADEDENDAPDEFAQDDPLQVEEIEDDLFIDKYAPTNETDAAHVRDSTKSNSREVHHDLDSNAEAEFLVPESSDERQQAPNSFHDLTGSLKKPPESEWNATLQAVANDEAYALDEIEDPQANSLALQAEELKDEAGPEALTEVTMPSLSAEEIPTSISMSEEGVVDQVLNKSHNPLDLAKRQTETTHEALQEESSPTHHNLKTHDELEPQGVFGDGQSPEHGSLKRHRSNDGEHSATGDPSQDTKRVRSS